MYMGLCKRLCWCFFFASGACFSSEDKLVSTSDLYSKSTEAFYKEFDRMIDHPSAKKNYLACVEKLNSSLIARANKEFMSRQKGVWSEVFSGCVIYETDSDRAYYQNEYATAVVTKKLVSDLINQGFTVEQRRHGGYIVRW